jgi:penicillin-binding protein 2
MDFLRSEEREGKELHKQRYIWASIVILGVFLILLVRLWQLQILERETFDRLSDKNRIRLRRIPFTRGIISDRSGEILVDNRPSFNLMVVPAEIAYPRVTLSKLCQGVQLLEREDVIERIIRAKRKAPFQSFPLKKGLEWDEMAWVETHRLELPGIWVEVEPCRFYPFAASAAHLIGYVGEITEDMLKSWRGRDYHIGDRVGKSGIEQMVEHFLRGRDGGLQVEVDAQGRQLMVLHEVTYEPGANVVSTLDMTLQQVAEEALGDRAGAVVAGDPQTGDILACVSHPSFDPNLFSNGISAVAWGGLLEDPLHPLQNRPLVAQYPPGSTYKIITALAGLEEGVITPETRLFCPGHYKLGDTTFSCWKEAGHGWLALRDALVQSCDVFFYQVGERVGVDRLAHHAGTFGFGETTGLDSPREKTGLVPTSSWKKKRFGEPWHAGETLSVAIGQSFNLVTPIQQFVMISAVANGGKIVVPKVIQSVHASDDRALETFESQYRGKVPVRHDTLEIIRQALDGVVQDPRGTGQRARVEGVHVAGKTGTAQVVGIRDKVNHGPVPYEFRDHAWFICFAPVQDPKIAVVVLVEHGGHGGSAAAPVAQRILHAFFHETQTRGTE